MFNPTVHIELADLQKPDQQHAILELVQLMALDAPGGGEPLADETAARLITELRNHPTTLIFLATNAQTVLGGAICFYGFSTFRAKRLINVHDLIVHREHRRLGVGRSLMQAVEEHARTHDCCGVTLEVDEVNERARALYHALGYKNANNEEPVGKALFFKKML